jgi:FeS assembly SUF system protein
MPEKIDGGPVNDPGHLNSIQRALLEGEIIESIRQVYDPELPINVYDLGLIYGLNVSHEGVVNITMTLTSPACPVAGTLPGEVEQAAFNTPGVKSASVDLVWDPPYTIDRMPEHIRLELGLF